MRPQDKASISVNQFWPVEGKKAHAKDNKLLFRLSGIANWFCTLKFHFTRVHVSVLKPEVNVWEEGGVLSYSTKGTMESSRSVTLIS